MAIEFVSLTDGTTEFGRLAFPIGPQQVQTVVLLVSQNFQAQRKALTGVFSVP
jgi:hypothetical protein